MAKTLKQKINLVNLMERYGDESKARAYLEDLRWPNGVTCPRCQATSISRIKERNQFDCNKCRYQFSVTSGTIFHDSHLPLWKWFLATYMMIESKKGVAALQLKRELGIAYQTAWYLCHRIRKAMKESYPCPPLKGIVEVDETFIGGVNKGGGRGNRKNKVVVLGAIQRGGKIILQVGKNTSRKQLHGFINKHVSDEADAIYTDSWPAYQGIEDGNTRHETVNHRKGEYVRGDVHTNTIEMVWQLFKRSVVGTFHQLSKKHMDRYLDELEWRFNNRENPRLFADTLTKLMNSDKMEYKELIA